MAPQDVGEQDIKYFFSFIKAVGEKSEQPGFLPPLRGEFEITSGVDVRHAAPF